MRTQFQTDPAAGLNRNEVRQRFEKGQVNIPVESPSKTVKQIIYSNIFTYFNMIFIIIAAAIIIFVGIMDGYKQLTFMIVIIANTVIGIVQEIRSKKTLDKLSLINEPTAEVIREGSVGKISINKLVKDDIVIFKAGTQIYADAVVREGSVQVNESLVTGESDEITKNPGDSLLSGSFVVSGTCKAQLTAVGKNSYVSKLTLDAKASKKKERAGMMKSLTLLIKIIGFSIIPLAILMMINQMYWLEDKATLSEAVVSTSAAILGMIPEGLYLLTTVALAVSVIRLARKKTLVHDLGCIEALARVNVLCVDKTGTITESKMNVSGVVSVDSRYTQYDIDNMLSDFVGNMDADNDTMRAIKEYFGREEASRQASAVFGFRSSVKYSAVGFGPNENYILGAPEFILKNFFRSYESLVNGYAEKGYRVLLFGRYRGQLTGEALVPNLIEPIGLILLINKVRENAKETFEYFNEHGGDIKVISGDNPRPASEAAIKAGVKNADKYVDATTLKTPEDIDRALSEYTVFGRVTPDQKKKFVLSLKKAGNVVAMTGDGINDVLALKEADCSIAMASGSDVACQVSDLVLLESDFSCMPAVVSEGCRVINNIERSASLFLVKNIFSFAVALISVLFSFQYPISPNQLTLINTVSIGIPSFLLALELNTSPVRGKFLRNVLFKAAPAALTDLVLIIGVVLFQSAFRLSARSTSTVTVLLIGIVGLILLWRTCKPMTNFHLIIWESMVVLFLLGITVPTLADLFSIGSLSLKAVLVFVVFALLAYPIMSAFVWLMDRMSARYMWAKGKIKTLKAAND